MPRESLPVSEVSNPARFFNVIDSCIILTLSAPEQLGMACQGDMQGVAQWFSPERSGEGVAKLFDEAITHSNVDDGAILVFVALPTQEARFGDYSLYHAWMSDCVHA